MVAWLLTLAAHALAGKSVRFVEPISGQRQRVYFANHTSHLDFILVWSSLPKDARERTRPVAGRDYWERERIRRYLARSVFNAVLIERVPFERDGDGTKDALQRSEAVSRMLEALDGEHSLILFPEGTRGSGATIAPFKSGLYHIARARPDLDLVPVQIRGVHKVLPKGRVLPMPSISSLTFGRAMRLRDGESREAFLARARDAIRSLSPP